MTDHAPTIPDTFQPFDESDRTPWSFRLAKFLIRCRIRGGHRLLNMAKRRGYLNRVVRYAINDSIEIKVPLFREDNCIDAWDLNRYERDLMQMLATIVPNLPGRVILIDGGADIGLFTMRLVAANANITSVHAFEPNAQACHWLNRNLSMLRVKCAAHCAALGEYVGRGELKSPTDDPSDHAKYISTSDDGTIPIRHIDDLSIADAQGSLVLKLDIEGAELSALRGARATIAAARQAVIVFEAHPRVAARVGVDPVECLRFLASIRAFEFRAVERPSVLLSASREVLEQLDRRRVYNIVAVSRDHENRS